MTSFKQTFDPPTSAPSQQTIETFTNNTQTMKADIIWALTTVVFGLSQNSNIDISNCFCATFPNNATAEEFSLGRTKSTYVVNHGLSPYFKELLTQNVNLSDFFVMSFDETFNSVTQSCEMYIIIRYWDIQAEIVLEFGDSGPNY